MAVALPDDNCVDVYSQDLGYTVLVGGGTGMTHAPRGAGFRPGGAIERLRAAYFNCVKT